MSIPLGRSIYWYIDPNSVCRAESFHGEANGRYGDDVGKEDVDGNR